MARTKPGSEVRIIYHREGFESPAGHAVRNALESRVCDWLMQHRVAHRHASDVFIIRLGPTGTPTVYIPDIILHDRTDDGRLIILEPISTSSPKPGGSRLLAAFRSQMKDAYRVIVLAKKSSMKKVLRSAYDVMIDADKLHLLRLHIPVPEE